jgi:hypothetical protein
MGATMGIEAVFSVLQDQQFENFDLREALLRYAGVAKVELSVFQFLKDDRSGWWVICGRQGFCLVHKFEIEGTVDPSARVVATPLANSSQSFYNSPWFFGPKID